MKIKTHEPVELLIDVNRSDATLCGECPHLFHTAQPEKNRRTAECVFGKLRWVKSKQIPEADEVKRHKHCIASEVVEYP